MEENCKTVEISPFKTLMYEFVEKKKTKTPNNGGNKITKKKKERKTSRALTMQQQ